MRHWKGLLLIVLLVAVIVIARAYGLSDRVAELRTWVMGFGSLAPLVYGAVYVVAVVLAVPGSAITVTAGVLFGTVVGVITVSLASTLGATLAFLIARYLARGAIASRLADNERFQRLDRLTERHGAIMVAITRLVPLFPFNLLNYGFGLTRVPLRTYVFWSWLCMLPGTVVYVAGSDALTRLLAKGSVPIPLIGVVVTMVVVVVLLARRARQRLQTDEGYDPDV